MQLFGLQGGLTGLQGQQGLVGPAGRPPLGPGGPAGPPGSITARVQPGVQFRPGQHLFGQVTGRQGDGSFLLRFGANTMTAQARVPLEVGQNIQVQVQGQEQGRLQLQVVKSPFTPMSDSSLATALTGMKLPASEENVGLAKTMVEHGVPLTKENFTFLKSVLSQAPAEAGPPMQALPQQVKVGAAWFLQNNQLPVSPQNVTALGHFIAANPQLGAQLFALQGELRRMAESPSRNSRALELLAEVPGVLGEYLLEPTSRQGPGRASRRLFDLARQAGIETHVGLQGGGGEQEWDLVSMMRRLRAALAGEADLGGALELMEGLEEHLVALQLINQARPDASLGFYYLQVPLRVEKGEAAEVWIRYRRDEEGNRVVDPEDCRIEFLISTEHLGDLMCTLEVKERTVHVDLGTPSEEVRAFVERYLAALVDRVADLGWAPGRVGATLRPFQGRPLVERRDFDTLETVNVQA